MISYIAFKVIYGHGESPFDIFVWLMVCIPVLLLDILFSPLELIAYFIWKAENK